MSHSHTNPPGQPAIRYRLATQAGFFREMLSRLRNERSLAPLTIRTPDDPAIALLDAWAMAADVLCFYQERIANESFLRTARDPRSLMAFAEQLGHQPGTGVAASVLLSFKVEEIPEAPGPVRLAPGLQVQSIPGPDEQPQIFETVESLEARPEWNEMKMVVSQPKRTPRAPDWKKREIRLAGTGRGLAPGDAFLLWNGPPADSNPPDAWRAVFLDSVQEDPENACTIVLWTKSYEQGLFQESDRPEVALFRTRASLFGHNAADWRLIPDEVRKKFGGDGKDEEWPRFELDPNGPLELDRVYPEIALGDWLLLLDEEPLPCLPSRAVLLVCTDHSSAASKADFGLSGQVTRIGLSAPFVGFHRRSSAVYAALERLELQEKIKPAGPWRKREIDLASPRPPLQAGRTVIVQGRDAGENLVVARRAVLHSTHDRLTLDRVLDVALDPATVTVFGNVAQATHGETVEEVLGSGAPEPTSQRFPLQQGPLTYLSSASRTGRRSTLEIRVDGVPWREVPSLHGHGPCDRVYTVHTDALGTPWACFGDGKTGAALPLGEDNVAASYRIGLGLAGNVAANSLTVLLTSPLGTLEVTNPLPASGGAGPERLTPGDLPVLAQTRTLGRLVSTADFEDFARGFAGIAKARAVTVGRTVLLTVALSGGAAFGPELAQDLLRAMAEGSAPGIAVQVERAEIIGFRVKAVIGVAPGVPFLPVKSAAERALAGAFSPDQRELGQAVHEQDVAAVLRSVRGVEIATSIEIERLTPPSIKNAASLWLLTETDLRNYEGTAHA